MDSSSRIELGLVSPSLKKSNRSRSATPGKTTPKRLYLRQSFPFNSNSSISPITSTTPRMSPGTSAFQRRQQLLEEAQKEREEQDARDLAALEKEAREVQEQHDQLQQQQIESERAQEREQEQQERQQQEQQGKTSLSTSSSARPRLASVSTLFKHPLPPTPKSTSSEPASAFHAKHAREISERLDRLLGRSTSSISKTSTTTATPNQVRPLTAANILAKTAPRLRTTETEYDVSPNRSVRLLSTPPRSSVAGATPSAQRQYYDQFSSRIQDITDDEAPASPSPFLNSPLGMHSRIQRTLARYPEKKKEVVEKAQSSSRQGWRGVLTTSETDVAYEPEEEEEEVQLNERYTTENIVDDIDDAPGDQGEAHDQDDYAEDQENQRPRYDHQDEEVSFRVLELASSSNQSTLVDHQEGYRASGTPHSRHHDLSRSHTPDYSPGLSKPKNNNRGGHRLSIGRTHITNSEPSTITTTPLKNAIHLDEDSLLEVADNATVITKQLRGVYSNLQQFFSPETEAKLDGAMSVIGSHKKNRRASAPPTATIPKKPDFEYTPPRPTGSPVITKRKPAPLRPAIFPSSLQNQWNQRELQRSHIPHQHQEHSQPKKGPRHQVEVRGLISSAESARRLSQGKDGNSYERVVEDYSPQETIVRPATRKTTHTIPVTVPEPFTLATESRGERHQERFQRKLDKWKRIDREHAFKALPLPTYPDLFIPNKSTRPLTRPEDVVFHTDKRLEERRTLDAERQYKDQILQEMRAQEAREQELAHQRAQREQSQVSMAHAGNIRYYSPTEVRRSTRPLTVPKSPNIGDKRRRLMQEIEERDSRHRRQHPLHHHEDEVEEAQEYEIAPDDGYEYQEDHEGYVDASVEQEAEYEQFHEDAVYGEEDEDEASDHRLQVGDWLHTRMNRSKRSRMEV
ncbi:hypothetical protein BGZ83_007986 [Gryganskiella cystojenkinii]|nr:hypothetical protein BGZ83_007986 [Gryganskiella cystojenkinii]